MPKDTSGLLSQYGSSDTLNELLTILKNKGIDPTYSTSYTIPGYGAHDKYTDEIFINPLKGAVENSLVHETQHAVNDAMGRMYAGISNTPSFLRSAQEQAFYDAYTKLYVEPSKIPNANTKSLGEYRGNTNELTAHGVGNMSAQYPIGSLTDPQGDYKLPHSHVDATMASNAAVMRDIYNRIPNTAPKTIQDLFPRLINYIRYRDPFGDTTK